MKKFIASLSLAFLSIGCASVKLANVGYKDLNQRVIIALKASDCDAAGITYTGTPGTNGLVNVEGFLHKQVPVDFEPTKSSTGVTSSVIAMYVKYTTPIQGAVILWNDAEKTSEIGRFTK